MSEVCSAFFALESDELDSFIALDLLGQIGERGVLAELVVAPTTLSRP